METKTIYIYHAYTDTGKKITRYRLDQDDSYGDFYGTCSRLIADAGKVLTDGITQTTCIDTNDPSKWTEIPEPTPEPIPEEDVENNG